MSEGQLIGSEDMVEDQEDVQGDRTRQDEQPRGSEGMGEEVNSLGSRAEHEIRMTYWTRGRCSRILSLIHI